MIPHRRTDRIRLATALLALCVVAPLAAVPPPSQAASWRAAAAAALPESGQIHLGLFNNGERDGFMRLGWHRQGDAIEVFDRSMMPSLEIYETMEITLSAADLAPRSMSIRFHQGSTVMRTDLQFEAGKVVGSRSLSSPGAPTDTRPVDVDTPAGTLARAVSFILPLLMGHAVPANVDYTWYGMPGLQAVSLRAADTVTVDTPAGSFEATRFELRGGSPENDIYVSVGDSPQVVRIDVLNEPLQFLALPEGGGDDG